MKTGNSRLNPWNFFFLLHDFYVHLLKKKEKTNPKNSAINEFVDAIKNYER